MQGGPNPNKVEPAVQKITPFLWFYNNAEEASNFYTSIFENSRILSLARAANAAKKAGASG